MFLYNYCETTQLFISICDIFLYPITSGRSLFRLVRRDVSNQYRRFEFFTHWPKKKKNNKTIPRYFYKRRLVCFCFSISIAVNARGFTTLHSTAEHSVCCTGDVFLLERRRHALRQNRVHHHGCVLEIRHRNNGQKNVEHTLSARLHDQPVRQTNRRNVPGHEKWVGTIIYVTCQ